MDNFEGETYEYEGEIYHELPATLLWSLGHYDGPMSGIAEYKGRHYYAKCHQSAASNATRWYWLYPLSSEEFNIEKKDHEAWKKLHGLHTDYDKWGERRREPITESEVFWEKYRNTWYGSLFLFFTCFQKELYKVRYEYLKRKPIGYFDRWWRFKNITEEEGFEKLAKRVGWPINYLEELKFLSRNKKHMEYLCGLRAAAKITKKLAELGWKYNRISRSRNGNIILSWSDEGFYSHIDIENKDGDIEVLTSKNLKALYFEGVLGFLKEVESLQSYFT